ncbi:MAG: DUF2795 domain-containing protein [Euryarchaeota archaeon]|nr:DUF2795 domain-containing protein [Euryarchaeota archaeon]
METENKSRFIADLPMETQEILKNITYPANRNDIIGQARESGAIPDILRELGMLPDKQYNSVADVAEELHIIYMGIPV